MISMMGPQTIDLMFRYNHYVELVEPGGNRACIKCCDDPADCPLDKGGGCGVGVGAVSNSI